MTAFHHRYLASLQAERLGREILQAAAQPTIEQIEAAVRVLRGAIAQERAWASHANDTEAQAEAERLIAVVRFLLGVYRGQAA